MKTAVELAWALIAWVMFCLSLYALSKLHVGHTLVSVVFVGILGLVWVTWHTHWKT